MKDKGIMLLEQNIEKYLYDHGVRNSFLNRTQRAPSNKKQKKKTSKLNCVKKTKFTKRHQSRCSQYIYLTKTPIKNKESYKSVNKKPRKHNRKNDILFKHLKNSTQMANTHIKHTQLH